MDRRRCSIKSIILAGGSGSRLWPLSRKQYPKQFLKLGSTSLSQDTVLRCQRISEPSGLFIVTNESQKFLVLGQLEEIRSGVPKENVLIEPVGKNTQARSLASDLRMRFRMKRAVSPRRLDWLRILRMPGMWL